LSSVARASILFLVIVLLSAPFVSRYLCRLLRLEKPNFRGDVIPASVGITFLLVAVVGYGGLLLRGPDGLRRTAGLFLLASAGFGLLGLADDLWGSRAVGGFKGHIRSLLAGNPTTGAVKLIGGGVLAFAVSWLQHGLDMLPLLVDGLLIALAANTLNLLDVRPGRAQFGFGLLVALVAVAAVWRPEARLTLLLLAPVICAALIECWPDRTARAMMGDTGSNLLGATAGLAFALALPLWGRAALLVALVGLNALAEKVSLSALIERTPWLRAADQRLGARKTVE
jgi:UDP-N-acetylmuramyl pentapeptide phosphotransferase/UDP-N-acetylglucosamine-1-phosphate transferase